MPLKMKIFLFLHTRYLNIFNVISYALVGYHRKINRNPDQVRQFQIPHHTKNEKDKTNFYGYAKHFALDTIFE